MTGFSSCPKSDRIFLRVYMFLEDAASKLETLICMDFKLCFKVRNLVSVRPKSIKGEAD